MRWLLTQIDKKDEEEKGGAENYRTEDTRANRVGPHTHTAVTGLMKNNRTDLNEHTLWSKTQEMVRRGG